MRNKSYIHKFDMNSWVESTEFSYIFFPESNLSVCISNKKTKEKYNNG